MTDVAPHLTAGFWRTRRSAAIAGIIFGVLLLAAMIMLRIALSEGSLQTPQADTQRRTLIRLSHSLVPFAGIAFLWFIGVVREQLGAVEDRLFSTVFMAAGCSFWPCCVRGQRSRQA
jgi:heme/copper-type cytochrome/quinol oxidase subunit 2